MNPPTSIQVIRNSIDDDEIYTEFDVEKEIAGKTIITVSGLVGQSLIAHFNKYPNELKIIERRKFEELVAEIWQGFGYDVELTKKTRDGGKDIIAVRNHIVREKYLIECKRPAPGGYVSVIPVRELYGVKRLEGATKAVLVTTARFSKDAELIFQKLSWELEGKDFEDLKKWLKLYIKIKQGKKNAI